MPSRLPPVLRSAAASKAVFMAGCPLLPLPTQNLLSGSLPAEWALPPSLVWLRLNDNRFTGTLPASMKLPAGLKGLEM